VSRSILNHWPETKAYFYVCMPCSVSLRSLPGTGWRRWHMKGKRNKAHPLCNNGVLTVAPLYLYINRAHAGDYSVIRELTALLEHPYADAPSVPTPHADAAAADMAAVTGATSCATSCAPTQPQAPARTDEDRWYSKTPDWARNLPGVAFMS
jgi:hypothetical protein